MNARLVFRFLATIVLVVPSQVAADPLTSFQGPPVPVTLGDIQPHNAAPENRGNEFYSEWWSFVFRLDGGYSAYVQFLVSNMGAGDDKAAVSSDFKPPTGDQVRDRSDFEAGKWTSSKDQFELHFGPNVLGGPIDGLTIHVENESFTADYKLTNIIAPWKPGNGKVQYGKSPGSYYQFQAMAPVAHVEGTVTLADDGSVHKVKGLVYADHSVASIGMHQQARRWARFRSLGEKTTFLLSDIQAPDAYGQTPIRFVALFQDGKVAFQSTDFEIRGSDSLADNKKAGYDAPRLLEFRSKDGAAATFRGAVRGTNLTAREDFLEQSNAATRFVVSKFAKPIMYYFDGSFAAESISPVGKIDARGKGTYYFTVVNP
jgi:hypothetical protein